jgi:hypothetical protein
VLRWQARTESRVRYVSSSNWPVLLRLGVSRRRVRRASVLVEPGGRKSDGADAVFRLFRRVPGLRFTGMLGLLPIVRQVAALVYRFVARHRVTFARLDRVFLGRREAAPSTTLVRWVYLRALGVLSLAAFLSLERQLPGLFFERGVRPLSRLIETAHTQGQLHLWPRYPSLLWLGASDHRQRQLVRLGKLSSAALALNIWPRGASAAIGTIYLSFVSLGDPFMSLQWDALLIENALHAVLLAPAGLRPGLGRGRPPASVTWLMRWLAFRLHFESGIAKLRSGDLSWRRATACSSYYETAPLPTRAGWFAHHLPRWFHAFSSRAVLVLETFSPSLGLLTRRMRRWGFGQLAFLQGLILATGNYGFFNLLSLADLLWFLDDEDLLPGWARRQRPLQESLPARGLAAAGGAAVFALSAAMLLSRLRRRPLPREVERVLHRVMPFQCINPYGLFAVMTTSRPEIVVEGSSDGANWRPYELRWKPGDPRKAPRFIVPHMPRLDWLFWFAALESPPTWFYSFLTRLLQGSPEVLALLAQNPFPDRPPRFVRARLYDYRMASLVEHRASGAWWTRHCLGTYVSPLLLQGNGPELSRRHAPA